MRHILTFTVLPSIAYKLVYVAALITGKKTTLVQLIYNIRIMNI